MTKNKLVEKVLSRRGYTLADLKRERQPFEWEEMDKVVEIVAEDLILSEEEYKVGVLYDVDVDGLYAGYTMEDYLKRKRINVKRYMNKDKIHGLNEENVEKFVEEELDWLFVVDAGSGDSEYINKLTESGIKVVVLDHHPYEKTKEINNKMSWILNVVDKPNLPKLSGCGVVYRFVEKLGKLFEDLTGQYEKYVGITVLSDMCDMSEPENRYYVKRSYEEYRGNSFLQQFKFYGSGRSFYSFGVIPYLNACIRIGEERHAMEIVNNMNNRAKMNSIDRDRKRVITKQRKMVSEIIEKSKEYNIPDMTLLLRVGSPELRTVGGLVCNKIMAKNGKPAVVMNREGTIWRGSFRSNRYPRQLLEKYSFKTMGHDLACGLEIENDKLKEFIKTFRPKETKTVTKATFTASIAKLKERTLIEIAQFNEFSGTNMESILIRIKEGINGALDVVEVSERKNEIIFENVVITDFTGKVGNELIVEPILNGDSYQLIRV